MSYKVTGLMVAVFRKVALCGQTLAVVIIRWVLVLRRGARISSSDLGLSLR